MLNRAATLVLALTSLGLAEQLPIRVYTVTDGLAHNHTNRIRQDSRGFLWFATDGGLSRFDGREFTRYTVADGLPHPWVNDFIEARDGTWWVASDGGVVQFNPKGAPARERKPGAGPPMFHVLGPPGPQEARRVNALAEDKDGSLLCATYDGLYRLRRTSEKMEFAKLELGPPSGKDEEFVINNLTASRQGGWWLAGIRGLFRLFEDGRVVRYTFPNALPDDFIETVMEDHSGRIWAATRSRGFCQVREKPVADGRALERCYSTSDGLPSNDVRAILQTSDGEFWIGTAEGLSEFHPENEERPFHNYAGPNGLSDQHILRLTEDLDGNLWIGTKFGGVMKMPRERFVTFHDQDGFRTAEHRTIFESAAGELLILPQAQTHPFIQTFDGHRFRSLPINVPLSPVGEVLQPTAALQDRTGAWWIGTNNGLFQFPKSTGGRNLALVWPKAIYPAKVAAGPEIKALFEDTQGNLWISVVADEERLVRWDRRLGRLDYFPDTPPIFKESAPTTFQEDASGSVWIGLGYGRGLFRFRKGRFESIEAPTAIFRGDVQAIHLSRSGQLWVATSQGGLVWIKNPDSEHPLFTAYTEAEGLSSNSVHCITEDQWGRIYAGTDSGVDRLNPTTDNIQRFTFTDGLEKGSVLLTWRDRHGALWFVTNTGASRLIPAPDLAAPVRTALISTLRINGKLYPISVAGEMELHGLKVGPGPNEVQVAFGSPAFPPGSPLQYQYRLEGAEAKWNETTSDQSVHYANLIPGRYRFLVRPVSSDGSKSQPASLSFEVLTPYWRRWWFLALLLTAALLSGRAAYHYRVSHLLALERVRTRIATDLHDDIGSTLSQIAILSEVAQRRTKGQLPDLAGPLADIGSISREVVESMSDIVWAIDPGRDQLRDLSHRMRRFATDVLTSRNIQLFFEAAGCEDIQLDPDVRRQFLLVLKEAVHNIVRHSGCTQAEIRFRVEQGSLRLRIWDNGNGLNLETADRGHGLRSMRQRADRLGGEIHVASSPEHGTTVDLNVPLARRIRLVLPHKYAGQISHLCNKLRLRNLLLQRHHNGNRPQSSNYRRPDENT